MLPEGTQVYYQKIMEACDKCHQEQDRLVYLHFLKELAKELPGMIRFAELKVHEQPSELGGPKNEEVRESL
jgi:hypothetical protein